MTTQIRSWLVQKTVEMTELANTLHGTNIPVPTVEFFSRGRVAGKAFYHSHKVTYNEILAEENIDRFIKTVRHEVAHLVSFRLYGRDGAGHSRLFKNTDILMGGTGDRCHDYDTSTTRVKRTKYVYSCRTCGKKYKLGPKLHRKQMQFVAGLSPTGYKCSCNGKIGHDGVTVKE